ncbi:recombinase family protein [Yoonia sp. F2084L]|uniref:recombinase family protein n=1 Tax=Yoonia sp. F2084L TaxID=2926419 RepID=UPI001FF30C98|nr:recombinase family protein [Yoonia sp. F2084L]MCK0096695.1 recombinase family protein [Yoonia sp. F2084L]
MNRVRCAIYTRKSSEDGLEQDFNSLDAQREACEAYVASQRHEGWELLPEHYDDGGISGGHLERPALQRLMDQVDAKQIDQIVVYKIDRLTRSLADFAKLVDRLDEAGASFVSVTQSFNTSTSMGRLTLNVLLSFAQFEREVTAERIRDKIAASKRKGLWMGGNVPLGYDPDGRTLKINAAEAQIIKTIYALYDKHRTMNKVREQAERLGLRSKLCRLADGNQRGGHLLSRGQLHHILTNPIYAGRIRHKGQVFEGQHPAIIDPETWERLQQQLSSNSAKERNTKQHRDTSPLAGKIFDEAGQKLTPSHTKKGDRRYRYYISQKLVTGMSRADDKQRTWRIPAKQLEEPIGGVVQRHIGNLRVHVSDQIIAAGKDMVIDHNGALEMIESVKIKPGLLTVQLDPKQVQSHLGDTKVPKPSELQLNLPFTERRRGVEMKLVIEGDATIDERLMRNIASANHWYKRIKQGATFDQISAETGTSKRRIQQMIHLAFLAPDVVRQITQGKQPAGLTSDWLLRHGMPAEWDAQRKRIGNL